MKNRPVSPQHTVIDYDTKIEAELSKLFNSYVSLEGVREGTNGRFIVKEL